MRKRLRIFISSPGDVNEERLRAHLVIQKLARDYARFFQIEAYLWEHEPMLASGHFQDAIEVPSASDVVLLILYARLGTPLPEHTGTREYRGIDGRAPVTGTEWEFEEALAAHRARGAPDLLAYRKSGDPGLSLTDPARRAEQERQWDGLESFWRRHFENAGMFLAGSARFSTVEEFDKRLEADLTGLIERRIKDDMSSGTDAGEPKWLKGSPFRGLAAYDFEDADIFFGRDAQTRLALTRLQSAAQAECAFLLVLGASGSGKSSLARAGILPAMFVPKAIPGVGVWRRIVFRPADGGEDPIRRFAAALASGDPAQGTGLPEMLSPGTSVDALAAHLAASADDPTFPFRLGLDRVAEQGRAAKRLLPHETAHLVVLVDQLEELFTRGIEPARRDLFLRILAGLARSGLVWVVATMRSDLWHRAAESKLLVDLVEAGARVDLARPDGAEVIEIIRRPAAAAGIAFDVDSDSGVALDAVIAQAAAAEPGVLPLLSVLLDTMYERDIAAPKDGRGPSDRLTFETYRSLGELRGAIAQRADHALAALRERDPEAAAAFPRVLRSLVTVSSAGDAVTSRAARLDDFSEGGPESRLISAFVAPESRLLVASASEDHAEVRLAHESLLENWPAARAQVQTDRRDLETRARIEALHRRWREAPAAAEKKRALLRGLNLAEGSDLVSRWSIDQGGDLGAFVRTSARADRLRRGWVAGSSAALALVFAAIAAFAFVESRRAEREAQSARSAETAERGARETADQQRTEAVRQRDRADAERTRAQESEQRTAEALRVTKRQAARALAAQSEAAAARSEPRRALALAIEAGETEREAIDPGAPAASEPALLRAVVDVRQVAHIQRPKQAIATPYAFLGDSSVAYADREAGIVVAEIFPALKVIARTALPEKFLPFRIATAPVRQIVAVSGGDRLLIVDARTGQLRGDFTLPSRITAVGMDDARGRLAVATSNAVSFVELDTAALGEPIATPANESAVGQVRFSRDGKTLLLSIGTSVVAYDLAERAFAESPVADLDATTLGIEKPLLKQVLAEAFIEVVHLLPDQTRDRLLQWHAAGVTVAEAGKPTFTTAREHHLERVLGVSFTDAQRKRAATDVVSVVARPLSDTHEEIQLRFVGDDPKVLTFERFSIARADTAGEKLETCAVSVYATHLFCQYAGTTREGFLIYRLQGGAHRFERVADRASTAWADFAERPGQLLLQDKTDLLASDKGAETKLGALPDGMAVLGRNGAYVVAVDPTKGEVGIWRLEGEGLAPVLAPRKVGRFAVSGTTARAAFEQDGTIVLHDVAADKQLAAIPGLAGLRAVVLSDDGRRLGVLTDSSAYVFNSENGRLEASIPLALGNAPYKFDGAVERLAYAEGGMLRVVDLRTQAVRELTRASGDAAMLAFAPDAQSILVGRRDGSVALVAADGRTLWVVPSPLGAAFSEKNAWPDQPPKGLTRSLVVSPDGTRLAIVRQDIPTVDLHELATGRYLTNVSTPWAWGVPSHVVLGQDGAVLTTWAFHAMTSAKPIFAALHVLPQGLDPALAIAKARLAQIEALWAPSLQGSAQ